jgi:hypothetical protein
MNRQDPNTPVTLSAMRSPRRRLSTCRFAGCLQRRGFPAPADASRSVVMSASVDRGPESARVRPPAWLRSAPRPGADPDEMTRTLAEIAGFVVSVPLFARAPPAVARVPGGPTLSPR